MTIDQAFDLCVSCILYYSLTNRQAAIKNDLGEKKGCYFYRLVCRSYLFDCLGACVTNVKRTEIQHSESPLGGVVILSTCTRPL